MKRILTLALALAMLAGVLTIPAGATYETVDTNHFTADDATNTDSAGTIATTAQDPIGSEDVIVKVATTGTVNTTNVYAITYSVTELTFTYNQGGTRIWNPETLKYENSGTGGNWDSETQEITVKNYSDLAVKVSAAVDQTGMAEEGNVTVTATKKGDTVTEIQLESAYNSTMPSQSKATEGVFEVKVAGTPVNEYGTATQMAKITLTVNKVI